MTADVRDPRFDRALAALVVVALSVGAWFFKDLSSSMKELSSAVSDLKTEVAVSRTALKTRLDELFRRVDVLEARGR